MRVFKAKWFAKFAEKESISDDELKAIVNELESGNLKADLGGDVYKKRFARAGEGKRGGYRLILFFKKEDKTFFEYAYPKSNRDNISEKELKKFKFTAKLRLALTDKQIETQVNSGKLTEIL
jgi:hypothetical protein